MKKPLYITSNGELQRKDNSLFFVNEDEQKTFIPVENTNDIFIFGEVNVSKRFLEFVSQKEICVHYFNYYGYYSGTFYPREHMNAGHVIVKQAECYLDSDRRLDLAKRFINGALHQMQKVLHYYAKRQNEQQKLSEVRQELEKKQGETADAATIEELMSVEGRAREQYYACFDDIIGNKSFRFEKRSKRPPKNRLNALISFGNSICYVMVLSEIYKTYLDPRIGFLHTTNFRRFSLNLDIAEIFKPMMVDRLIFSLLNKNSLNTKHFDTSHTNGIWLNEKGRRLFIAEMDERMKTTVQHPHLGRNVSYRRLLRLEAYKVLKHILGEKEYEPYRVLW